MPQIAFDPALLRLWRQVEGLAAGIRRVEVLAARAAPAWRGRGAGRWDELGAHQHAVPTAVGCLAGVVRVAWAGHHADLHPGEMLVVAPAAWHVHAPLRPGSACWAQGLVFGHSDVLLLEGDRHWSVFIPAEPSAALLHQLVAEADAVRRCRLGAELVRQCTSTQAQLREVHPAVGRMAQRMWSALHRPMSAAEVLAASGLGQRQAHRLFLAHFGAAPKQVIREQQLALAAELLREGVGVAQVAAASGFTDRRALTRAWRLAHGVPPTRRACPAAPAPDGGGHAR